MAGLAVAVPWLTDGAIHDAKTASQLAQAHQLLEAGTDPLQAESALTSAFALLLSRHAHNRVPVQSTHADAVRVERMKAQLVADLSLPLALSELAAAVDLSPFYATRLFSRSVGLAPHAWRNQIRLNRAQGALRQGQSVATVKPADVTAHDLAELMVGSELPTPATTESTVTDVVVLEIDDLVVDELDRAVVSDFSVVVHRGEVVGIAGVEGNGQAELVDAIIGTRYVTTGTIKMLGEDITNKSVRYRREHGIGYIPQDRQREGLLLNAPLWENAALGHQTQKPFSNGFWMDREGMRDATDHIREAFDVRTPNIDVAAHALSGGNQQKLIVGREMSANPTLLIASHPTRGIDVGAQAAVWDQLRAARAAGLATLLISADLDELIGLSDTIVVMLRGRLVATLDPATVTPRDLGAYMTGAALQTGAS
jgi:simple sugar transport system ATP-binding protein